MSKVTVLLNRQEDKDGRLAIFSRFRTERAYREGDALEAVYSYEDSGEAMGVLTRAFAKFNRGSGMFVGDEAYPQRSLSAGDVVEVDGVRYSCEYLGWEEVERDLGPTQAEFDAANEAHYERLRATEGVPDGY